MSQKYFPVFFKVMLNFELSWRIRPQGKHAVKEVYVVYYAFLNGFMVVRTVSVIQPDCQVKFTYLLFFSSGKTDTPIFFLYYPVESLKPRGIGTSVTIFFQFDC